MLIRRKPKFPLVPTRIPGRLKNVPESPEARAAGAEVVWYILKVNERLRKEKKKKIHDPLEPESNTDAA